MTRRTLLAATLAAVACAALPASPSHAETAEPAVNEAIVRRAADLAYSRELARAHAKGALDIDKAQLRNLRSLLQPLVASAGAVRREARMWHWAIAIESRDEPIAWCLPGGRILVSTGLFDRTRLTLPEVGAVLAHVIAHALAADDADEAVARYLREGGTVGPDPNRAVARLAEMLAQLAASEPHDAASERAADTLALELMARSGVDPRPTVDAWRKIMRSGGAAPPTVLALHPPWSERINELEAQMPRMVELYETTLRDQPPRIEGNLPMPMPGRR